MSADIKRGPLLPSSSEGGEGQHREDRAPVVSSERLGRTIHYTIGGKPQEFILFPEYELSPSKKLSRLITSIESSIEGEYPQRLLQVLFSGDSGPEVPLEKDPTARLTDEQRRIRKDILAFFGIASAKEEIRKIRKNSLDRQVDLDHKFTVVDLNMGFINNPHSLTHKLNHELGMTEHLNGIAHTDFTVYGPEDEVRVFTRAEHSRLVAQNAAKTLLKFPLISPDLFLEWMDQGEKWYAQRYQEYREKTHGKKVDTGNALELTKLFRSPETLALVDGIVKDHEGFNREALVKAVEFTKYVLVYGYIHDAMTLALGDIAMKALDYDENKMLAENIFALLGDEKSGLPKICRDHNINPVLLGIMIHTAALKEDKGPLGQLNKDKSRRTLEDGNPYKGEGFDHDALVNLEMAMVTQARRYLPGGFHYIPPEDDIENPYPLEQLVHLMTAMHEAGMSRKEMEAVCIPLGISKNQLFVSQEKFVGARFTELARVKNPADGIQVSYGNPETLERIRKLMVIMGSVFFQAEIEGFIKSTLRNGNGKLFSLDAFTHRNDKDIRNDLAKWSTAILLSMLSPQMRSKAKIMTSNDLEKLLNGSEILEGYLIAPIQAPIVLEEKASSYVLNEVDSTQRTAKVMKELPPRRGRSVDYMIAGIKALQSEETYYCVIKIGEKEQQKIGREILHHFDTSTVIFDTMRQWSGVTLPNGKRIPARLPILIEMYKAAMYHLALGNNSI